MSDHLDQLKAEFGQFFDCLWDQFHELERPDMKALSREAGVPLVKCRDLFERLADRLDALLQEQT